MRTNIPTLRAPSAGSGRTYSDESQRGAPKSTNGIRYWTRTTDISKTDREVFAGTRHQTQMLDVVPGGPWVLFGPLLEQQHSYEFLRQPRFPPRP